MADTIVLSFEIFCTVVGASILGWNSMRIVKNLQQTKHYQEQKNFLRENKPLDVDQVIQLKNEGKLGKFVIVEGKAVSGSKIITKSMDAKLKKSNIAKGHDHKHILFTQNIYTKPKLFYEVQIDQDIEGETFYLIKDKKHITRGKVQAIVVNPSTKTKFHNYDNKVMKTDFDMAGGWFKRVLNTFFLTNSYLLYNKYGKIVYEGDSVKLFGVAQLNMHTDQLEFESPLAFINGDQNDYTTYLSWQQASNIFFSGFRLMFCGIGLYLAIWGGLRLLTRMRNRLLQIYRESFRRQDIEEQIHDAPPFGREGVNSIEIESYQCSNCKADTRSMIFLPCKDCYLCQNCYNAKEDKWHCDRCNQKIDKIIRIYISNQ